ncbi:Tripeptidyl-peptidase 2 [Vitis vinifera]|uniref:Tripeptidyl-peptidase 2 n=1 Tax=Vitis vinifera TaxID=29760 RepID=A0A438E2Q7_VITVI|nr:Tripeptidyl-peptidase 2 [Vitis vinifera]
MVQLALFQLVGSQVPENSKKVRDAKIKVLGSLKHGTDEERSEWRKLAASLKLISVTKFFVHHSSLEQSEYPKYTPLLAKILEGLVSDSNAEDNICHDEEVIDAANEVVCSIDRDELAKYFSLKSDPEDEEAEKMKKKMETTRDQLAEALYQKGLALAEIESLKVGIIPSDNDYKHGTACVHWNLSISLETGDLSISLETGVPQGEKAPEAAAAEGTKDVDKTDDQSALESTQPDLFEENFKELKKWVDIKSSKYGTLWVVRERRCGRLGTALKVLIDMIQDNGEPPKKKLYELKLSLIDEIGWAHLASYERQWMLVRFPPSLPLF